MSNLKVVDDILGAEERRLFAEFEEDIKDFRPSINVFLKTLNQICPIQNGFNILGSPSGNGKTTLSNQIVITEAQKLKDGEYILVISNEQTEKEFNILAGCLLANIHPKRLSKNHSNPATMHECISIQRQREKVAELPIHFISDKVEKHKPYFDYRTVKYKLEETCKYFKRKPHLVVFDYIQNITADHNIEQRILFDTFSDKLVYAAKHGEYGAYPILGLVQLDKTQFRNGEPQALDNWIKYSQGIFQRADSIFYYYFFSGVHKIKSIKTRFLGECGESFQVGMKAGNLCEIIPEEQELDN